MKTSKFELSITEQRMMIFMVKAELKRALGEPLPNSHTIERMERILKTLKKVRSDNEN